MPTALMRLLGLTAILLAALAGCAGRVSDMGDCPAYLTCAGTIDGQPMATLQLTYGEDGDCWENDDNAGVCRAACTDALAAYEQGGFDCAGGTDTD